ncbi:MAG: hypothetical protein HYV36_07990 [Lentisphaerae bacterium]|nr:hypothetical protein [Lentisphaerota bacterium]
MAGAQVLGKPKPPGAGGARRRPARHSPWAKAGRRTLLRPEATQGKRQTTDRRGRKKSVGHAPLAVLRPSE